MLRIPQFALLPALLLVGLLVACGGSDPTTAAATSPEAVEPGVIELSVRDGEVSGAERRVAVPVGSEVTFTADIPGVFEAELEVAGLLLVELEVS